MLVVVKGDIESLQPSIDFYLGVVGKGSSPPKEIRDKYFEVFKKEDSLRKENFLQYKEIISDDYLVSYDEEPLLVDSEEEYVVGGNFFSDEEYPEDEEVYSNDVRSNIIDDTQIEGTQEEDEDEFIVNSYEEVEEDEFIDNSYEVEEDEILEDNYEVVDEGYEFVENLNSDGIIDTYIDGDDEFIDYSSSSDTVISSLEKETINLENEKSSEFITSNSLEKEKIDLDKENVDAFIEYSSLEEENYMIDTEDYFLKEEKNYLETEKNSNFSSNSLPSSDLSRESFPSEKSKVFDVSSGSYGGMFEEGIKTVERSENKKSDIEVPKDLRDFVKLHYNCEMSFALQYFSKKDIDKQLSLGRVFKRKNRLLI